MLTHRACRLHRCDPVKHSSLSVQRRRGERLFHSWARSGKRKKAFRERSESSPGDNSASPPKQNHEPTAEWASSDKQGSSCQPASSSEPSSCQLAVPLVVCTAYVTILRHRDLFLTLSSRTVGEVHRRNCHHHIALNAAGTELTSTLQCTVERPQHEAVPTHADEAAESVPAGLPRWARSGVQLALIYI